MTKWTAIGSGIAATVAILAGCNAVLGIDEAKIDLSLLDGSADATNNDSGGGDASDDTASGPATCAGYCAAIMKNCTGTNREYTLLETCLAMCPHFEPGIPGDTSSDSLECRNYHARLAAAGDPNVHCRHAGPVGGGTCGMNVCIPYCSLVSALCGSMTMPPFPSESACRSACPGFTYIDQGDAGDLTFTGSSDTLNCRIYHLESAYDPLNDAAAGFHCPHTAVMSSQCSAPIEAGADAPTD
jgi:hypothetical protein